MLLDTFGALTKVQDWETGRRPIVWVSNNFLVEQTGFSLPTVRRHVRRLCEAGLIWMKDSPNGKRWGCRDEEGYIKEAYGFHLSSLAARTAEFEALYEQLQEERQFCASLRNVITVTRRIIRSKIEKARDEAFRGPWEQLQEEFTWMMSELPGGRAASDKLLNYTDAIKELKTRVEKAFQAAFDWPEKSDAELVSEQPSRNHQNASFYKNDLPTHIKNDTHILTTNYLKQVTSNSFEKKHAAGIWPDDNIELEVKNVKRPNLDISWSTHDKSGSQLDIPMLMVACPHFAEMAHMLENGYIRNWNDLHRAAAQIRAIAGISEDAWNMANEILGPARAAAVIALIFDKHSNGEIKSAGDIYVAWSSEPGSENCILNAVFMVD